MKIAVDAMGGDYAPAVVVEGALQAAEELGIPIILVGDKARIEDELAKHKAANPNISIVHASEVVAMDESPAQAIRKKKDSSLRVCFDLVKSGAADATNKHPSLWIEGSLQFAAGSFTGRMSRTKNREHKP